MPETSELSEREREILHLVATGKSNKEIARTLFISTNTVKVHLRNIFSKIGASSRTEAAMFAVSAGLVDPGAGIISPTLPVEIVEPVIEREGGFPQNLIRDRARRYWWLIALGSLITSLVMLGVFLVNRRSASLAAGLPPLVTEVPRWEEKAPLPLARRYLAVTAYENYIYAIGGETPQGVSGALERFDPETNIWDTLSAKLTPVSEINAAVIGGKIYVPGGKTADDEVTNILEIYDPRQDAWKQGAPLPLALSGYAMVAHEGNLYLFGGWDGHHVLDSVFEYDPDQNAWNTLMSMPTARVYAGSAVSTGKIYVFGGFDGEHALKVNEVYLPGLEGGKESAWSKSTPLPEGRYGMGAASLADIIHVIGGIGEQGRTLPSLEYPPQVGKWQAFESPLPEQWSNLGLVTLGTRIYVVGGELDHAPTTKNLSYQAIYIIALPVVR